MIDHQTRAEQALLVHITVASFDDQATLEEFVDLARAAGVVSVGQITGTRQSPEAAYFVGSGKLQEIKEHVQALAVDVVLFNHSLSPIQERNLERALECRVLSRTGVILDIFAQRARSFEGKLQVELAQLEYMSTRLVRGWTHLERQKGGIGLRGPGETQLESDRRLLANRIKNLKKRLQKVSQQREISRKARRHTDLPLVSLVGYTNAGKSTLFNRLTKDSTYVADQLFATLDTTLRRVELPNKTAFILADTVGFIQHLPHDLVTAFRATLEETRQADLLLHVVDASDEHRLLRIEQVNQVLTEIGAESIPQITVYNKIDRLPNEPRSENDIEGNPVKIWLSASKNQGIDLLYDALSKRLNQKIIQQWVRVPVDAGRIRAQLFELGTVLQEKFADNGDSLLEIRMQLNDFKELSEFLIPV